MLPPRLSLLSYASTFCDVPPIGDGTLNRDTVDKRNVIRRGSMGKYGDALSRNKADLRAPF